MQLNRCITMRKREREKERERERERCIFFTTSRNMFRNSQKTKMETHLSQPFAMASQHGFMGIPGRGSVCDGRPSAWSREKGKLHIPAASPGHN